MRGAFQLNYQALVKAIEIHDVRSNAVLPPELSAVQLGPSQQAPQGSFSRRKTRPEFLPSVSGGPIVEESGGMHSFINVATRATMTG
jgi:hypothetical protein